MEQCPVPVPPHVVEHVQEETLHVLDLERVPPEKREVLGKVGVRQLRPQQVRLVQEEDDGDLLETLVVDDRVEDITAFFETGSSPIFNYHLVKR